ncbi:MAG: hypothetical protein CMD58_02735 [Gammaproteobacteria bacterium]|nr:hypothetical protein [Gammaproteobacteria bacterium]
MGKSIIGANFLEKFRSSDYKSSVYAMAEIIDNSVDAKATEIEIITITKNKQIKQIYFIDNGKGMNQIELQNCVVFSESNNLPGTKNTGIFGMGLPNSSLSQCTCFSISTKINDQWMENKVDFDDMKEENSLEINDIFYSDEKDINYINKICLINDLKTIVKWDRLDNFDAAKPETVYKRIERLIGRIHRYNIRNGLQIRFLNYSDNNVKPDINNLLIENDPLYLTEGKSWIAKNVFYNPKNINYNSSTDSRLSTSTYYNKFKTIDKESVKPLFYKPDEAQEVIELNWNGKVYKINLILSLAYKDIQKPGISSGGITPLGKEFSYKVRGVENYPSANISWVRNNREITFGNYSLFNVTQENMRFWSIELNYNTFDTRDNVLDELLGLSNSKQSIKFQANNEYPDNCKNDASASEKKQELMARITNSLNTAISKAKKILSQQAREWSIFEKSISNSGVANLPTATEQAYSILLDALGKGKQLPNNEQAKLVKKIKKFLPSIPKNEIEKGVQNYSNIGLKNIILYCELDDRDLFQTEKFQGNNLTLINIKHPFYYKVLEPLKSKNENDMLASLELLISSLSRVGQNSFFDESYEIIKEFYELTSKDLKSLLQRKDILSLNNNITINEDE